MTYLTALILVSLAFALWEACVPSRPQRQLRSGLLRDLGYLLINGHLVGSLVAIGLAQLARAGLSVDIAPMFGRDWPFWLQLVTHLVLFDFMQWGVHNLLHRVDFLWRFHKVHHQIQVVDWLGNFHFHPVEILVYRTFLWLPSALFLFDPTVVFATAVIGTAWGHFNHANVKAPLGPLAYVFNGPEMHLWHHAHLDETRGRPVNFAIVFSLWDWLFGTAWFPSHAPRTLGFPGVEEFPEALAGQLGEPFRHRETTDTLEAT